MNRRAISVLLGLLLAVMLTGCAGGGANRPQASERPTVAAGRPEVSVERPDATAQAGQAMPAITPPAIQRPAATAQAMPAITPPAIQRPNVTAQVGQGQVTGAPGQGVTVTVTEDQLNKALSQALSAASNPAITAISVDLRPGVIGVSATLLVEGKEISTQMGLAPVVDACSLSLSVVEEPSQPSGIPAPLWDAVLGEVVAAIEAAIVTPQRACISAVTVSDGEMSATVARR